MGSNLEDSSHKSFARSTLLHSVVRSHWVLSVSPPASAQRCGTEGHTSTVFHYSYVIPVTQMVEVWVMNIKLRDELYWCQHEDTYSNYRGEGIFFLNQNLVDVTFILKKYFLCRKSG